MNSKQKGKRGELELANLLRSKGYDCRRGVQYKGSPDSPDVVGLEGIHIECKRVERNLSLEVAILQAIHDAGENEIPVVMHRKNREFWKVTMDIDDWLKFYDRWRKDNDGNGSSTEIE